MRIPLSDTGGYRPLPLPSRGEALEHGRQYALSPISRLVIEEVYGLRGIPTFVTCLRCRVARTRVTHVIENLETGQVHRSVTEVPEQDALFEAYFSVKNRVKFTIDLPRVREAEAFYADSPKLKKYEDTCEMKPRTASSTGLATAKAPRTPPDLSILDNL